MNEEIKTVKTVKTSAVKTVKTPAKKTVADKATIKPTPAAKKAIRTEKTEAKKIADKATKSAKKDKATDAPKTFFADPKKPVKMSVQRLLILKALKALKATSADNAQSAESIAIKAKNDIIAVHTVQHYLYKNEHLAMCGFTAIAAIEGHRGLAYHLTSKGLKACDSKIGEMI